MRVFLHLIAEVYGDSEDVWENFADQSKGFQKLALKTKITKIYF